MVCVVPLWCPIRLFGLPSAAKLSRESRGYLLVLADLTHLWGGIFIGTTGTKVSIFHIFSECGSLMQLHDLLGEIFRIFRICNILLLDEWQYILSLVICSIIQHWWLILIVGGWLIVAMLQYVMAAHTDPSPAATSSADPSHLILLFLHSHILVLNMKANNVLFSVSNSIDFERKKTNNSNKQTNKSCQQRAVDRRRFAAAFALPINIKRLWTV